MARERLRPKYVLVLDHEDSDGRYSLCSLDQPGLHLAVGRVRQRRWQACCYDLRAEFLGGNLHPMC